MKSFPLVLATFISVLAMLSCTDFGVEVETDFVFEVDTEKGQTATKARVIRVIDGDTVEVEFRSGEKPMDGAAGDAGTLRGRAQDAGCESIDASDDWDSAFHKLLVERVEPGLVSMGRGVHLRQYPAPLAALSRLEPRDPSVAQRFESYAGGLELANGFGELTDARLQRRRFRDERRTRQELVRPVLPLDEPFLRDLEGMPPASGVALGLDRLIMLVTAAERIDNVVAF